MEFLATAWQFIGHLDEQLDLLLRHYGVWIYVILFLIVFCETGLVVTPFLPGDSLLFAAGTFAALGSLNLWLLLALLGVAAVAGDTANYWIGHYLGDPFSVSSMEAHSGFIQYVEGTGKIGCELG